MPIKNNSAQVLPETAVVECFFLDSQVRRNKSYRDRFQLIGQTIGGRRLKIIFQLKPGNVVRIITGWQL